jgi:hypothetical protein
MKEYSTGEDRRIERRKQKMQQSEVKGDEGKDYR